MNRRTNLKPIPGSAEEKETLQGFKSGDKIIYTAPTEFQRRLYYWGALPDNLHHKVGEIQRVRDGKYLIVSHEESEYVDALPIFCRFATKEEIDVDNERRRLRKQEFREKFGPSIDELIEQANAK